MKALRTKSICRTTAGLAGGFCIFLATSLRGAFVYESPTEFFAAGDFNGDGVADVLVLDKATGNARVGYSDGNGNLTWSAPLVTGVQNATGCGVEHFLQPDRDAVAVTAPAFNLVNLVDLSQTNSASTPQTFTPVGVGPHAVAGLRAPRASISPGLPFLLVASSFNDDSAEDLDLGQLGNAGYGTFPETGPFELANGLDINPSLATLAVGIVRGATNDALHLWEFDATPGVVGAFSNLPPGSSYVFGNFNGEVMPRFIFYQPGGSNLTIVPLLPTNSAYAFGPSTSVALTDAIQNVFFVSNGLSGSVIIQFSDSIQGLTLPGASPALTTFYSTGVGAAGNAFNGVVPLANGQFALLDAPSGAASAHVQVINFDGTNFTKLSSASIPAISSRGTRANVWLFQLEPFVNRSPGFIASLNSPDWADGVGGLPTAVQVPSETDAGITNGLGNISTNNLGAPPAGSAFGIANQYNPAISVFSYGAPQLPQPVAVTISPPPGSYGSPQTISFTAAPASSTVEYRVGDLDSWHAYASAFSITNDVTIQYYGTSLAGARAGLQFATYSLGNPADSGSNRPININPGDTNTVAVLSTNQLTLSPDGTIFYGRRSAAGVGTIWAINLDGSSDTYITTGARPRVSSDGRWLAFLREGNPFGNQGNVWIRDLQSGAENRVFANPNYITGYDWETNGTDLLMDYGCGIWDLNTGGSLASLIYSDCFDDAPVRNPANSRIAFQNLNPNSAVAGIYLANPDGTGRQRIVSSVPGASWPAWSADGQMLVFADGNNTNANSGQNLWLAAADGGDLIQLSGFTDGTNGFPHGALWALDDEALVAAGTISGTNGLWLIPLTEDLTDCDGPPVLLPTSSGDAIDFAGSIVVAPSNSQIVSNQAPGLYIRQTPEAVVVYWNTNLAGYTLESKPSALAGSWTPIAGPYYLDGIYLEYWETRANLSAEKFFRLHLTGAMVLSQPPQLTIQAQTNFAVISWSSGFAGFTLQSKTELSPTMPWVNLPGPYQSNGGNFEFAEPVSGQQKFFRLSGP